MRPPPSLPRVIQALFPERRVPAGIPIQRFARTLLPPHPATVAQPRAGFGPPRRPPHPATVQRARAPFGPVAQRKEANVHAFKPPEGFLGKAREGQPLPSPVKRQMESYFGADFSDVRVHVGGEAASIGALAFTLGSDIYFAPEHYQPHTMYGKELLGHELMHVLQQRDGRVQNPYGDGVAVVQDLDLEAEADMHGKAAAQGKRGPGSPGAPGGGGPGSRGGAQAKGGYQLLVGTYMHDGPLPEALAGHSFVAIEDPSGERRAFGFSPAHYGSYDPNRDLHRLEAGVEGVVHDDAAAFEKPGVKTRAYSITREQAEAARAKVAEYQEGRYRYSADRRQCSTFALDVMRAAHLPLPEEGPAPPPRLMYEALDEA